MLTHNLSHEGREKRDESSANSAETFRPRFLKGLLHCALLSSLVPILSSLPRAAQAVSLPTALGWTPLPNTQMQNVCPPGFNCANVIIPWSGGIADTTRNRLIVWGGGHTDYGGNEVYAFDLNTLSMVRLNNPAQPLASSCVDALSGPSPNSRHTYDTLAYIAHAGRMLAEIGSLACSNGSAAQDTWTLDLASVNNSCEPNCNASWTDMHPAGSLPDNGGVASADYDPNTKNVFLYTDSYGALASYNYDTNTYKILSTFQNTNNYTTAVIDPTRKIFFIFGGGGAYKIDISGTDTNYTLRTLNAAGCNFKSADAPGVAYDSDQDRIVGWSGGETIYLYNPDTDSCTPQNPGGTPPGAQQTLGTYGRFRYFPGLKVFALVNDASQNAYILRLTNGATPPPPPPPPTFSPCDVNHSGTVDVVDVQLEVNWVLNPPTPCPNPSGQCTVIQVQRVVNAALGGTCVTP